MSRRALEIAAERRAEAGLPVLRCPECGELGAHWVADRLDEYGLIVPGHFICGGAS